MGLTILRQQSSWVYRRDTARRRDGSAEVGLAFSERKRSRRLTSGVALKRRTGRAFWTDFRAQVSHANASFCPGLCSESSDGMGRRTDSLLLAKASRG